MKAKHLLYILIIAGLLVPMGALTVLAEEGDIPMWIHRARLAYIGRSSGGPDSMVGYIHIRDATLDMVEGATVTAEWTLPDGSIVEHEASTNSRGIAEFRVWVGRGEYTICVTDVTKAGWAYDPDLNFDGPCATLTSADSPNGR